MCHGLGLPPAVRFRSVCQTNVTAYLVPGRLAGGAVLSPRWESTQRIARGTFRKVPIEAAASIGRGGATECTQGIAAITQTAIPQPMRSATTSPLLPAKGGRLPPIGSPRICHLVPLFRAELPSHVSRPCSWRSVRFSRKRRSNRALASFPGSFANRENEACEICDDEAEPHSPSGRDP